MLTQLEKSASQDLPLRVQEIAALIKQESLQIHDYQEANPPKRKDKRQYSPKVTSGSIISLMFHEGS